MPHTAKQKFFGQIRDNFSTFCNVTQMHGFYEIHTAKSLFWKTLWSVVVIVAIVLTMYQTYSSARQYANDSKLTLIEPLDTSLLIPPLSLCFQHWIPWVNWKKAYALNFTKQSLLYGFSFLTDIFSPTVFDTTEAKLSLLQTMKSLNITTISELYRLIAKPLPMVMGLYDKARLVDDPPFFKDVEFRTKESDVHLCYKLDGDKVYSILMGNRTGDSVSSSTNSLFNFSTQDFKYEFVSSYMTENEYSFYVSYWLLVKTNYWLTTLPAFLQNFTGFAFPYRVYPDTYSEKYVEISDEFDSYAIEMVPTAHRWMNKVLTPCVENRKAIASDTSCLDKCQADRINDLNLCLPLDVGARLGLDQPERLCQKQIYFLPRLFDIYRQWTGSISDLFTVDDDDPIENTTSTTTDNETIRKIKAKYVACQKSCISACEIWNYEFTSSAAVQPTSVRALSFANQTDVNIYYPDAKSVLIIIEESAQTWDGFIADVGGVLGIWTGASLISLLEIIYYCCFYKTSCHCVIGAIRHPLKPKIKVASSHGNSVQSNAIVNADELTLKDMDMKHGKRHSL